MKDDSKQLGFTLVELLVAIVVFAFGGLALYRLQAYVIDCSSFSNRLTQATVLAQEKMESLMALPYNHPLLRDNNDDGGVMTDRDTNADGVDDRGPDFDFGLNNTVDGGNRVMADGRAINTIYGVTFNIYWNIAADQPMANVKTIRVIVTWRDHRNLFHHTSLTSMKAGAS